MTEAEAARIVELDRQINEVRARLFGTAPPPPPPLPPMRPYIPQTVVTLLDGSRFLVACQSLTDCYTYAEWVLDNGYREIDAEGIARLFPAHQVKMVRVRKTERP